MWELDTSFLIESWVPKNWCFWTVVLEKILKSPLDCNEVQPVCPKIQSVLPKGDLSWIFFGKTDALAEAPILWPPDSMSWLIWKDPDVGKDWRQEEKEMPEEEIVGWHHQLPQFTQTHVHWVSDAIQPSHPLSSPSPPAPNPSQHQSLPMSQLFQWSGQSTGVSALASLLPKKSQGWSPSEWTGWISLQSKGLSRLFSNTTVQKQQFFSTQPSSQSNSHIHTWPQEKP